MMWTCCAGCNPCRRSARLQEFEGERQKGIAGENRHRFAIDFMICQFATAVIVVVHGREVVVNEE